ncbi:MAG: hypothetical protein Q7K16_03860 [Candidatus Azambacteria bacterium]|nr:hypothetical protein [Candidatus Azambacteria bacterium]
MEFVTSVDNYFISLFTKFTKWFMQLTGRTNFFLAKIVTCFIIAGMMTMIINFWFPLLHYYPTSIPDVIIGSIVLFICLKNLIFCDRAEEKILSDERVKVFGGPLNTPIIRFVFLVMITMAYINIPGILMIILDAKGILIFKIIYITLPLAMASFMYFLAIDPPMPCKGKIHEWVESFAAGFKKLVPIKIHN